MRYRGLMHTLDPAVENWRERVIVNGGTVSSRALDATNKLTRALRAAALWSLFRRLNPCVGDQLAASLVPLINTSGGTTDTNVNLVASDYSEALGWRTDGATKSIDTGYTPSEATGGMFANLRTTQTTSVVLMGCRNSGSTQIYRILWAAGPLVQGQYGGAGGVGNVNSGSMDMLAGLWAVERTSTTDARLYHKGVQQGVTLATPVVPATPGAAVHVMAQNAAGVPGGWLANNSRVTVYGFTPGLTVAQSAALYTIVQAFETAMGRAV